MGSPFAKTIIDLRSDTVTLPKPEMINLITQANLGDDILGEDPTVSALEAKAAKLLGMESALLVISGTMANQIALMTFCQRGQEVIMGEASHMYNMEAAGIAVLSQVQVRTVSVNNGYYNPKNIESAISLADIQKPETGLICLENTYDLNAGFTVTVENMREVKEIASKYNIPVYLDGARIFNAAIALGVQSRDICEHVDAIQFCLTKGLGCPLGSILAGSKNFIEKAKINRQRLGGGMRQAGIVAAPAIYALDQMIGRLEDDNNNAKYLKDSISRVPGIKVNQVQSNIVSLSLINEGIDIDQMIVFLKKENILVKKVGLNKIRMVIHYQITRNDINFVVSAFTKVLK